MTLTAPARRGPAVVEFRFSRGQMVSVLPGTCSLRLKQVAAWQVFSATRIHVLKLAQTCITKLRARHANGGKGSCLPENPETYGSEHAWVFGLAGFTVAGKLLREQLTLATIPERSTAILLLNVMFVVNYFSSLLLLFPSCVLSV